MELLPHESREILLVVNTNGLNGPSRFIAGISTDATPSLVTLAADVEIRADWVVRKFRLGELPAGVPTSRRIQIDNVPAKSLVRLANPKQPYWSARLVAAGERSVEVELAGTPPMVDTEMSDRRSVCDVSLFFTDADVRRVQILATGFVTTDR